MITLNSWILCTIAEVTEKVTDGEHATPRRSNTGRYLLSARNVRDEGIDLSVVDYVPNDEFERIRRRCNPDKGDILISCSGSIGRVAIVDKDNEYVMVRSAAMIKPAHHVVESRYLAHALRSPLLQEQMVSRSRVTAQPNLFLGQISNLLLPLPPLAEQRRIVERVDQLMGLCNTLETRLREERAAAERLAEALCAAVVGAAMGGEVSPAAWDAAEAEAEANATAPKTSKAPPAIEAHEPNRSVPSLPRAEEVQGARAVKLSNGHANDAHQAAAALLAERGTLTNGELQAALGIDGAAARAVLKGLVAASVARQEGERRGTRYVWAGTTPQGAEQLALSIEELSTQE